MRMIRGACRLLITADMIDANHKFDVELADYFDGSLSKDDYAQHFKGCMPGMTPSSLSELSDH